MYRYNGCVKFQLKILSHLAVLPENPGGVKCFDSACTHNDTASKKAAFMSDTHYSNFHKRCDSDIA